MLHSFGGNDGMWGDLVTVANEPLRAAAGASSMVGMGISPEGINQNWVMYELMLEAPWRQDTAAADDHARTHAHSTSHFDVKGWLDAYSDRRSFGMSADAQGDARAAWTGLRESVYNLSCAVPTTERTNRSLCPAIREPGLGFHSLNREPTLVYSTKSFYNHSRLVEAWSMMIRAGNTSTTTAAPLQHDLIDVGREVLAVASDYIASTIRIAVEGKDVTKVKSGLEQVIVILL
jgi:alpha-N-acetylglucosaminidase